MKRAVSLLAVALFATNMHAQQGQQIANRGSITGVVKDVATGLPLDRVNVTIMGTALGWTTGSDGRYTIANVPAGIVTLHATRLGYVPFTIADFRVVAGTPSIKDISLTVQALRLGANLPISDIEVVRGQAAAALYRQWTGGGTAGYACDDPLRPRDVPACVNVTPLEALKGKVASVYIRGSSDRDARATGPGEDAYSQFLFAPELVMKNQGQIGLTDAQRTRIIGEMSQAQAKFTEIQWTLSGEEEKLSRLLQGTSPAETAVIAQMDRILAMEETLKRTQMLLLVRIKNVLTPEQQAALSRLRE